MNEDYEKIILKLLSQCEHYKNLYESITSNFTHQCPKCGYLWHGKNQSQFCPECCTLTRAAENE